MRRAWPAAHRRRDAGPSWSAGRARVPCQSSALEDARPGCSRDIRPGMWTRRPGGWWPGVAGPGGWWPGVAGPGGWRPGVAGPGGWRPGVARPGGWRLRAARPGGGRSRHRSPIKGNPTGFRVTTRKRPAFPPSDGDVEIAAPQKRRPNGTQQRSLHRTAMSRSPHPRSAGRTELSGVPSTRRSGSGTFGRRPTRFRTGRRRRCRPESCRTRAVPADVLWATTMPRDRARLVSV